MFAKRAATNVPAAHTAGKNHLHGVASRVLTGAALVVKACGKAKLVTGASEKPRGWLGQQSFAGPVHQSQTLFAVKGKDCNINFRHDSPQQGCRLERTQSLFSEGLTEIVYLQHHLTQGIAGYCASSA